MDKRLRLANELLTEGGVIFISIDDNELAQLRLLCDDIFGQNSFINLFVWKTRQASGKQISGTNMSSEHEYILCIKKNKNPFFIGVKRDKSKYKNPDNDSRGVWQKQPLDVGSTKIERPNCYYEIEDPNTGNKYLANPNRVWAYAPDSMSKLIAEGKIIFDPKGKNKPALKKFFNELKTESKPISTWLDKDTFNIGFNTEGTKLLNSIFSGNKVFDYPKPLSILKLLVSQVKCHIVLDFMAGTGTTGHAVLELNKEDNGNRQFILCTNNENNICEEVTYERIKRVMQGYTTPKGKDVEGLGGELKYLKTDFVKKQKDDTITDEDRIKLTYEVGCVLALKENTFDEVKQSTHYQIFSSPEQLTAIYFSENKIDLSELVDYLQAQDKPCKLYLFSWTKGEYKHEFSEYDNIIAEDIPEPILDVYKNIGLV